MFRNPSCPFGLGTGLGGAWGLLLGYAQGPLGIGSRVREGFSSMSFRSELAPICPRPGQCPLPNLPVLDYCGGTGGRLPQPRRVQSKALDHVIWILVSWSLLYSGACRVWSGLRWGWRPQGGPFMILAWAAPHLQETPPFQQEEFRLRHFQLPA